MVLDPRLQRLLFAAQHSFGRGPDVSWGGQAQLLVQQEQENREPADAGSFQSKLLGLEA